MTIKINPSLSAPENCIRFSNIKEIEVEASANTGKHFTIIEAVSVWNAMEKTFGGKGQTVSESDRVRIRASKLTGYSHDSLSKAKYVLDNGNKFNKKVSLNKKQIEKLEVLE